MERVAAMIMVMAGQGGHGWARFRTRLSLSFDFSRVIFAREKKWEKERGSLGTRLLHQHRRSTDLLEKYERQRRQNDPKDWWQAKIEQSWTQKADCSFKFKRETARALKIYFETVSDRGNETIVETIAIVKQAVLASKK